MPTLTALSQAVSGANEPTGDFVQRLGTDPVMMGHSLKVTTDAAPATQETVQKNAEQLFETRQHTVAFVSFQHALEGGIPSRYDVSGTNVQAVTVALAAAQ